MKFTLRFLLPGLCLLFLHHAHAQFSVYSAVQALDSMLQEQAVLMLTYSGEEDPECRISFSNDAAGIGNRDIQVVGAIRPGILQSFPLTLSGRYEISNPLEMQGLELSYGAFKMPLPLADPVIIEHTAFWFRIYDRRFPEQAREVVKEDALSILALLSVSAGLAKEGNIPASLGTWRAIAQELEENPFIRNQLGALRLSLLPGNHPLLSRQVVPLLNQMAARAIRQVAPSMEASQLRAAPAPSYFSIQDIEKNYRAPVIADAALELRAAGDRIQTRRTNESGFNATAIAAGLTDFVIERAKEEFSVTFLERMQSSLADGNKTTLQEIGLLFPQTRTFFTRQLDVARYKTMLPMAREAFLLDLRNLGLNLHQLLELEAFQGLKNTGEIYNLALFYDIASMAYQGIAMDTLMQNIFTRLERREQQLFRQGNKELAQKAAQNQFELGALQTAMNLLSEDLDQLGKDILQKNVALEALAFPRLLTAAEKVGAKDIYDRVYEEYLLETGQRDRRLLLWLGKDRHEQLLNIPLNLDGRRYYDQILRYPRLDQYEQHFTNTPAQDQIIASGIELSKKLVAPIDGESDLPEFFVQYFRYLHNVEKEVVELTKGFEAATIQALRQRVDSLERVRLGLETDLAAEIRFWQGRNQPNLEDGIAALTFLQKALQPANDPGWTISRSTSQDAMQAAFQQNADKIKQAQEWILTQLSRLEAEAQLKSPLAPKILEMLSPPAQTPVTLPAEEERLQRILEGKLDIQNLLRTLDTQHNQKLSKAYEETIVMESVVEMALRLMDCLRADGAGAGNQRFLSPSAFRDILGRDRSRDLFLGIAHKQLEQTASLSALAPRSVAAITTKFVDILYQAGQQRDSLRAIRNRKLQFADYFPFVRLGMDMLSTLIEHPLTEQGGSPFASIRYTPQITNQTLAMFENVQAGRFGYAIHNLVELFSLVSKPSDLASRRWNAVRQDLLLYGSFMANVATAQTSEDIKAALMAVALPPGSSRVKRQEPFNVALNAYLGVSGGREVLTNANAVRKEAFSLGMSLPVGISTSWKFNQKDAVSYSLLLSVLDLGTIAAFRLGDQNAGLLPELSFSNLVAPGAFFLLNVPKSPFSFGVGGQYGPSARKITSINGLETSSSAWRLQAFFGIDVPIFNFATSRAR